MPSKICFQPPCSVENEVADGFDEALKFCEKKGPMEMPFYGSQSQFYGICETDGGANPGKPCIFPFIWSGETFYGKLYDYIILKSFLNSKHIDIYYF